MEGVSLRDYFAAAALQGMMTRYGVADASGVKYLTKTAFEVADAMLVARKIPCRICGKPLADGEVWMKAHRACSDREDAELARPELRLVPTGGAE